MKGQIFISYRRAANAWAIEKLRQELAGAFGEKNLFLDTVSIEGGADWNSRIDDAIRNAAVVVVVFCREWYGTYVERRQTDPTGATVEGARERVAGPPRRRIDDPDDKLRIELEMAGRYKRPVLPIVIDDSPDPRREELPESVRFVCDRQFLRLNVGGNAEKQMARLVSDVRRMVAGHDWMLRVAGQAFWIGLIVLSFVAAVHERGGNDVYRAAFARAALTLRDKLDLEPPKIAVAEMSELEYRELFGGRSPLDPELVAVALRRLRSATTRCDKRLPVVLALDIAPSTEDNDERHQAQMNSALLELARCRPVVLSCPPAVRRGAEAIHEMRWMEAVIDGASKDRDTRIVFATGMADPEGLRRAQGRSEMGVVAADLAAGRTPFVGHERPQCVCPVRPDIASMCAEKPLETAWHERGFAVPLQGSSSRRPTKEAPTSPLYGAWSASALALTSFVQKPDATPDDESAQLFGLHQAIGDAETFMQADAVLIGSGRSQMRHSVPGRPRRAFEGVSSTVVHAHLLNGALHHEPVRGGPHMAVIGLLVAWGVAALTLVAGRELERNNDRYAHRGPAYVLFALALVGVPLLVTVAAAALPASMWWLGLVMLAAVLAAVRALMSCFEIVLSRGVAWRWPNELYRELLHGNAKSSAGLRLVTFGFEATLIVMCLGLALYWHWG